MPQNLRTGTRVASGFALVLLVLVALTLVGIVRVNMINASLATIAVFRVGDAANAAIREAA